MATQSEDGCYVIHQQAWQTLRKHTQENKRQPIIAQTLVINLDVTHNENKDMFDYGSKLKFKEN